MIDNEYCINCGCISEFRYCSEYCYEQDLKQEQEQAIKEGLEQLKMQNITNANFAFSIEKYISTLKDTVKNLQEVIKEMERT